MKRKLIFVILLIFEWALCSCTTGSKSFEIQQDQKVFMPTGTQVPAKIQNWSEIKDSLKENLSPEILASIRYQYQNEKKELAPESVVYFLKSKSTANLKLIENRSLASLQDVSFGKTDFLKLKSKRKIIYSSYSHHLPVSETSGNGTRTISTQSRETLYATAEAESQLVVAVSYRPETPDEKQIALDFIEKILFAKVNNAQNAGKVLK